MGKPGPRKRCRTPSLSSSDDEVSSPIASKLASPTPPAAKKSKKTIIEGKETVIKKTITKKVAVSKTEKGKQPIVGSPAPSNLSVQVPVPASSFVS